MRAVLKTLSCFALLLALSACASTPRGTASMEEDRTMLRVENRSWSEMVIYVIRSSQRVRLGSVPGVSTRTFALPGSMVGAGIPLRFQADPIGSDRAPISQEITVTPGEEVQLYIPPQ